MPAIPALPEAVPGGLACLLSRYSPRADEIPQALNDPRSAYTLTAVGGWLQTHAGAAQRRKRLVLVGEGSLVCPPAYPAGCVRDVKPDYRSGTGEIPHSVYRSGLALAVGWPA